MKMFNATLEEFIEQCDSKVFRFKPYEATEVDDYLVQHMYKKTREKGIFILDPRFSKDQLKKAVREAQIEYLEGTLRKRIRNYLSQKDDYKKAGVTLEDAPELKEAMKWDKELRTLLEKEAPLRVIKSFKDFDLEESLSVSVSDPELFNPENIKAGNVKKKATSFADADENIK